MNFRSLFQTTQPVRVGLIGTGDFGRSFLSQARKVESISVAAICDRSKETAAQVAQHCGFRPCELSASSGALEAIAHIATGKVPILEDGTAMAELPLDVVVEATGSPEAGARNAYAAMNAGKHVVMVSKETACVVGPILARKAREAGVVYTTGDGDQPSLCLGLITWAESIGLEVVCAGKAAESDFVYHADACMVTNGRQQSDVSATRGWPLWQTPDQDLNDIIEQRGQTLADLAQTSVADYAEMAIVMNDTGYGYDRPVLHAPIARLREVPDLLRHVNDGGLLSSTPVIDTFNCLRRPHDAGMSGGVFVVVKCFDHQAWRLLRAKGHLLSRDDTHAMLYIPHHLLGVETVTSVLSAALLGLPTGGDDSRPVAEVVMRANRPLKAGQQLNMDRGHAIDGIEPEFSEPQPLSPMSAVPYYLAAGNQLLNNVEAGTLLTYGMLKEPENSTIWSLKREQDQRFL